MSHRNFSIYYATEHYFIGFKDYVENNLAKHDFEV